MASGKKLAQGFGARAFQAHGYNGFGDGLPHQQGSFRRFESEAINRRFPGAAKQLSQPSYKLTIRQGA